MEKLVIKKETPIGVKVFYFLLGLFIFLVSVTGAFFIGSHFFGSGVEGAVTRNQFLADENARLSEEVKTQMTQMAKLQLDLIAAKSDSELQRLTAEGLRKAVDEEMRRRLLVEKELSFYRKVSGKKTKKYQISKAVVKKGAGTGEYLYQLTVRKTKKDGVKNSGNLVIHVNGKKDGAKQNLRIPALEKPKLAYGFKIFQMLEGKFSLDSGFTPDEIKIDLVDNETGRNVLAKTYSWKDVFTQ